MFDGLKDKLGAFRQEAEATAEEKAEPIEDDDPAADADSDEDVSTEQRESADGADATDVTPGAGAEVDDDSDGSGDDVEDSPADTGDGPADVDDGAVGAGGVADGTVGDGDVHDDAVGAGGVDDGTVGDGDVDAGDIGGDDDGAGDADDDSPDDANTSLRKKARSFTRGKFVIEEEDLDGPLQDLEMALLASDVELDVAQELLARIREELIGETRTFTTGTGEVVSEALGNALLDVVGVGQFDFDDRIATTESPVVITFTGVNGVGKTTSIAKLVRYLEARGHDSVIANGDTFRAGANEQIEAHAEALDAKLIAHDQGGDPAAVIYDAVEYAEANDVDVVLGDTAGRLHTSEGLMDQLEKIDRVVDPDVTLFVDEAVAGQDAVNRAREFDAAAEIDGAILTKADADAQGGAAISIAHVTGKPILFLGTGQGYEDLERFDPEWLVEQLLAE